MAENILPHKKGRILKCILYNVELIIENVIFISRLVVHRLAPGYVSNMKLFNPTGKSGILLKPTLFKVQVEILSRSNRIRV